MSKKRHTAEEIVAKLRQVDVLTAQGRTVAEAIRQIGVTEVTYYYLWTALPLQAELALIGVGQLQTSIRRHPKGAQMANPLAHASIAGRPQGPR